MFTKYQVREVIKFSKMGPVLTVGLTADNFENSTVIDANIPVKELGMTNTSTGLKYPTWFSNIKEGKSSHQIVIDGIDSIDKESQEVFYELLKYKAISDINLPSDCTIIVTAKDLKNVSETIIRLCLLV